MSSTTNTAINSRSMNGVISISDGVATLENGDLDCEDINSSSINTTTLSTNNLTCKGTFLSNTNGTYTIPITTTSITGSLISYNNTNGNGETDFTNYGSTYNTLLQGFRFWNVNSTQTLTNLAIIDNTQTYFKSQLVGCSAETPLNTTSIVNKSYADSNFLFKTGTVSESINGIKTFTNRVNFNGSQCIVATGSSEFVGANGYFMINPNMGGGTFNPASQNGTIGIIGLKDQTNDKVLFTLYGSIHVSLKLSFSEVSMGFGGGASPNTSVTCDGTNVIIKPNIKFSGDNTIQNSAFTGASSLNGTYNLSNVTIDTNGKITSLSSGLTTANIFTNTNTFNSQATFNNSTPICSVASPSANNELTRKDYIDINFIFKTGNVAENINGVKTFLNRVNCSGGTALVVAGLAQFNGTVDINAQAYFVNNPPISYITPSDPNHIPNKLYVDNAVSGANILGSNNIWSGTNLFNNVVTFANNLIFSASTINLNSSGTTHNTNFFTSITSGTHSYLSNLSNNSVFNMFSSATSDVNLDINARVKFRQVKLYNQVKSFGGGTLTFPLEENILIRPLGGTATITLPLINSTNQLGLTFNFIKNSTTALITFTAQGTNTIVRNGSITGTTSDILLGAGQTSTQLTILELVASSGIYNWVEVNSSLPQQISNPVGQVIQMAMGTVPTGYLACNGGSYSSSTYPALSAFLNFTYGGSSGSGLFQVPDFRGMFLRGNGTNGIDSTYVSSSYGSLQTDGIRSHTHGIDFGYLTTASGGGSQNAYNSTSPNYNNPGTGGGRATGITTSNNNPYADTRPGNFAVLFCIKY